MMTNPIVEVEERLTSTSNDEGPVHIFCCQHDVSVCGVYRPGPFLDDWSDEDECESCLHLPCTVCGCRENESCDLCENVFDDE